MKYLAIAVTLCMLGNSVSAVTYDPTEMRGLRNGSIVLGFSAVKTPAGPGVTDQTVAHFDISSISGDVSGAMLHLGIGNIDPGDPAGSLDVYSFAGDGTVSVDE